MISYKEAKKIMVDESPVVFHGIHYRKIVGLILRKDRKGFIPCAELLDENTHSITQARLSQIDKSENEDFYRSDNSDLIAYTYEIIDELENLITCCYQEKIEPIKQHYINASKKLIILDKGIGDANRRMEDRNLIDAIEQAKVDNRELEKYLMDEYLEWSKENEALKERTELFDEDDPETKGKLEEFMAKEDEME